MDNKMYTLETNGKPVGYTAGKLKEILNTYCKDDDKVILSSDEEGNQYMKLFGIEPGKRSVILVPAQ